MLPVTRIAYIEADQRPTFIPDRVLGRSSWNGHFSRPHGLETTTCRRGDVVGLASHCASEEALPRGC